MRIWFFIAVCVFSVVASSPIARGDHDVTSIQSQIDELLLARIGRAGESAAPLSDDAEFLRRVYLDLSGQVPSVSAARDFLDDEDQGKRAKLVDRLLSSPKTFDHLAEVWRNAMLPMNPSPQLLRNSSGFHAWLRKRFSDNLRYDRIVSDLIAANGTANDGPALFFTALELEPKKLASATSRIFLGLQLECAECHDHPFDDWKQEEFWGYAAFFARLPKSDGMMQNLSSLRLVDRADGEVTLPDSEQVVLPKFPGGRKVGTSEAGTRRQQLSIWMSSRENPYVARAAVNRVWALLFGRGLVDPVDDLGAHNPASHPELLELLTDYFIETDYDLRNLVRTLCGTHAYQRTSRVDASNVPSRDLFLAMAVKVLSAEQVYDSLRSTLSQTTEAMQPELVNFAQGIDLRREQFIAQMMGRSASVEEYDRGLQQALRLMNGNEIEGATNIEQSPLLISLRAPFFTDTQRIDILYLATLSRYPSDAERQRTEEFLQDTEDSAEKSRADVLWALLNSAEFALNH